jgi:hypothetical protein
MGESIVKTITRMEKDLLAVLSSDRNIAVSNANA